MSIVYISFTLLFLAEFGQIVDVETALVAVAKQKPDLRTGIDKPSYHPIAEKEVGEKRNCHIIERM